jgi:hypothetical protein
LVLKCDTFSWSQTAALKKEKNKQILIYLSPESHFCGGEGVYILINIGLTHLFLKNSLAFVVFFLIIILAARASFAQNGAHLFLRILSCWWCFKKKKTASAKKKKRDKNFC